MWALFKHDFRQYFNSPLGYVLLGIFFSVNGLFLWIFSGIFNLIEAGFGDLSLFFELNPWLLLVFVPALSMKSFADEIKRGTLEIILTNPLEKQQSSQENISLSLPSLYLPYRLPFFMPCCYPPIFWKNTLGIGVFFGGL